MLGCDTRGGLPHMYTVLIPYRRASIGLRYRRGAIIGSISITHSSR